MRRIVQVLCLCGPSGLPGLLIVLALLGTTKPCQAGVYAWVDVNGKLVVSDRPENPSARPFDRSRNYHRQSADHLVRQQRIRDGFTQSSAAFAPLIARIAADVGVNENLLHAVIQVESAYDTKAVSNKGARGLMQLVPATAERFGVIDVHDPESNIRGGARYLKNLLGRFGDDLRLTLAAYNAGEGTVQKYKNTIPPYPETEAYVAKVLEVFEMRRMQNRNSS